LSVLFIKISQFLLLMVYMGDSIVSSCQESGVKVQKIVQVMKANGRVELFFSWHNSP